MTVSPSSRSTASWITWRSVLFVLSSVAVLTWVSLNWRTAGGYATLVGLTCFGVHLLGTFCVSRVLSRGPSFMAVARTLFDEGHRRRIVPSLYGVAIVIVGLLAAGIEADPNLSYGVQSFLTYSIGVVLAMSTLTLMVVACGSVSTDLEDRIIYTVLTKPIARGGYLFGKWLGLVAIIAVGLVATSLEIYLLARGVAIVHADTPEAVEAVEREIFTARIATEPRVLDFEDRVEYALKYLAARGDERSREEVEAEIFQRRRVLEADETRTYRFDGLVGGAEHVLRLRPRMFEAPASGRIQLELSFDGEPPRLVLLKRDQFTHLVVPPSAVLDHSVEVSIRNREADRVVMRGRDGLEVLRPAAGFSGNIVRSFVIYALYLAFIAALGVLCGAFLSFPVACLSVLVLSLAAAVSNYLLRVAEKSAKYARPPEELETIDRIFAGIEQIGVFTARLLAKFGGVSPTRHLVEGRLVSSTSVLEAGIVIGGLWIGGVVVVSILLFQRREIARVQV